ncbi:MAG: hypothetical protein J1F05_05085 [Muribaculaceae bacterium]|nr:hypothetical protein [Muribaculaceae bacterium]
MKHHNQLKTDSYKQGANSVKNAQVATIGAPMALLLVLFATLVPFFLHGIAWTDPAYRYIYAIGAAALFLVRLFTPYKGPDFRLKRLHRIESWSALFFCVASFFLFYQSAALRDWLAFTLAGAAIQIYTSIAIPLRETKLEHENSKDQ